MDKPAKLFIGRWAPFHKGHQTIIDSFINNGHKVVIAIRDTDYDDYTIEERARMIDACYEGHENPPLCIGIPDIDTVCIGRGVGYALMEVPETIKTISATAIREDRAAGDDMDPKVAAVKAIIDVDKGCASAADGYHLWLDVSSLDDVTHRKFICAHCPASKEVARESDKI